MVSNRGCLVNNRGLLNIANELNLEEYMRGVVPAELGPTIYDEIDRLERRRTGERSFRDNVRASKIAMLAALGMLMAEVLLTNTRYRRIP